MGQQSVSKPSRSLSPQVDKCETQILPINKFTITWTIINFSNCPQQTGEALWSGTFTAEDSKNRWRLRIYVRGKNQGSQDYVSLFLHLTESDRKNVGAKCRFSIKTQGDPHTKKYNFTADGNGFGWEKFIQRSFLFDPKNRLLPDDKLTIECCISVAEESVTFTKAYTRHDFGECVILNVGGEQLNVHKSILLGNSPVFSSMFSNNTKESQTGRIDICDTEPEVIREMLQFMYTGTAPNLKSMSDRLLIAADKYQVIPLKLMCEEAMCDQLSVDNSCSSLVQADRHSAERLKSAAVKFITARAKQVSKSDEFKSLVQQYPQLFVETFQTMTTMLKPIATTSDVCVDAETVQAIKSV